MPHEWRVITQKLLVALQSQSHCVFSFTFEFNIYRNFFISFTLFFVCKQFKIDFCSGAGTFVCVCLCRSVFSCSPQVSFIVFHSIVQFKSNTSSDLDLNNKVVQLKLKHTKANTMNWCHTHTQKKENNWKNNTSCGADQRYWNL